MAKRKDGRGTITPAHDAPKRGRKRAAGESDKTYTERVIKSFIDERASIERLWDAALAYVAEQCEETGPCELRHTHSAPGRRGVRTFIVPDDAPEQVFDAINLAEECHTVVCIDDPAKADFWSSIRAARNIGKLQVWAYVRGFEYAAKLGAMANERTKEMRETKAERAIEKRAEKKQRAIEGLQWAYDHFPTEAADNRVSFLSFKAADHLKINISTLYRWLAPEK
jgi:hypothetical protein